MTRSVLVTGATGFIGSRLVEKLVEKEHNVTSLIRKGKHPHPKSGEIIGRKSYDEISQVDGEIEVVDVFRPSDQVLPIIIEAIKKKPKVIWLQEGIHNEEAEELARNAGIKVVFNRCMLAEHRRLC